MGQPHRNKKNYSMTKESLEILVENEPPGYFFNISSSEIDLSKYKQSDDKSQDLAWYFAVILWRKRISVVAITIVNQIYHIDRFFEFVRAEIGTLMISDFNQNVIDGFIYWLSYVAPNKTYSDFLSEGTKRKIWGSMRSFFFDLIQDKVLDKDLILPINIFDKNEFESFKQYDKEEFKQILSASHKDQIELRLDKTIAVKAGRSGFLTRLIPHAFLLSARTGINPEVLFDMDIPRLSLKHSSIRNSTILELPIKKRSGGNYNLELLDYENLRVKNDVVRLLEEVEQLTNEARNKLNENDPLRNKLWLAIDDNGEVNKFNKFSYYLSLQAFSKRHNLKSRNGETLSLNFRRFRPTFAELTLELNGGDYRDLQKKLGHKSLRTTMMHYIDPNLDKRKDSFVFAGKVMTDWALSENIDKSIKNISILLNTDTKNVEKLISGEHNMNIAKCNDPYSSPLKGMKKGELCTQYLACFRCGNCVVLKEDSYRLFSFYYWLIDKKNDLGLDKWTMTYEWIIEIIDNVIAPQLGDADWIAAEKQKAKNKPFIMWPITIQ